MRLSKDLLKKKSVVKKAVTKPLPPPYPTFVSGIGVNFIPIGDGTNISHATNYFFQNTALQAQPFLLGTSVNEISIGFSFGATYANGIVQSVTYKNPITKISRVITLGDTINGTGLYSILLSSLEVITLPLTISQTPIGSFTFNVLKQPVRTSKPVAFALTDFNLPLYPFLTTTTVIPKQTFGTVNPTIPTLTIKTPSKTPAIQSVKVVYLPVNLVDSQSITLSNNSFDFKVPAISVYTPDDVLPKYIGFKDATIPNTYYNFAYTIPYNGTIPTYLGSTDAVANKNGATTNYQVRYPLPISVAPVTSSANINITGAGSGPLSVEVADSSVKFEQTFPFDPQASYVNVNGASFFTVSGKQYWGRWLLPTN